MFPIRMVKLDFFLSSSEVVLALVSVQTFSPSCCEHVLITMPSFHVPTLTMYVESDISTVSYTAKNKPMSLLNLL